jgi:hypothetical protein
MSENTSPTSVNYSHPKVLLESKLILCNGFKLCTSQEALQEEKVQILCRSVSVDSTGHVFADMKLKGEPLH